jgi:hypothetical protein
VRARDLDRLALQQAEGVSAGLELFGARYVQPAPLSPPRRETVALNPEASDVADPE